MKIEMSTLDKEGCHNLITSSIAPLPVSLISTVAENGIYNAAPFSMIAPISSKPPILCFSCALYGQAYEAREGQRKDTVSNIGYSHDFVINVVDENLIKRAVQTSVGYPSEVDEIKEVGLTAVSSEKVKSPRIAEAKVSLECRLLNIIQIPEEQGLRSVIFGEVIVAHIKDGLWVDGKLETVRLKLVGRMEKNLYCRTTDMLEVKTS